MKTHLISRICVLAGLVALFIGTAYAGSWYNQLTSPYGYTVSYTGAVAVPSAAYVQQGVQVFNVETIGVNQGPLGYFQATYSSGMLYSSGNVAANTYNIYQAIVRGGGMMGASGVSFTTIQW